MNTIIENNINTISRFKDLLNPFDPVSFLNNYWEKRFLHIIRGQSDYFTNLFSSSKIDFILKYGQSVGKDLVVWKSGDFMPQKRYVDAQGKLNINQLYAAYADGYSIEIVNTHHCWDSLDQLCKQVQIELSHVVGTDIIMMPKGSNTAMPCSNSFNKFVLQIEGKSHWNIYNTVNALPMPGNNKQFFRPEQLGVFQSLTLNSGDLVYIPRGMAYELSTQDTSALFINVWVQPTQWIDLFHKVVEQLPLLDPEFRRSLPPGYLNKKIWTPEFGEMLQQTFQTMLERIMKQMSLPNGIAMLSERFRDQQTVNTDNHFRSIDQIADLKLETTLVKRANMSCQVHTIGAYSRIIFPGNIIKGPARIDKALQFIADAEEAFTIDQLPDLNDKSKVQLAARLIRGGLLKVCA